MVQTIYIDPNTGNLGIGTTAARENLDIVGNTLISGNVGIGTTAPLQPLHIQGSSIFNGNVQLGYGRGGSIYSSPILHIASRARSTANITTEPITSLRLSWAEGGQDLGLGEGNSIVFSASLLGDDDTYYDLASISSKKNLSSDSSRTSDLIFSTSTDGISKPSERMCITSEGTVGIGTTAPRQLLDVQGGHAIISGNLGIGTTNPRGTLHLYKQSGTEQVSIILENRNESSSTDPVNFIKFRESSGASIYDSFGIACIFTNPGGNANKLFITATDQDVNPKTADAKVTFLQSGSVGIGTTAPRELLDVQGGSAIVSGTVGIGLTNPIYQLHVNGTTYLTSGIRTGTGSYSYNRGGGALTGQVDNVWLACGGVGRSPAFIYAGGDQLDIYAGSGGQYVSRGYFSLVADAGIIDFTGQHRSHNAHSLTLEHIGLILISSGIYKNLNGSNLPSINEALPIVELAKTPMDKRVYGVLSDKEEDSKREYKLGLFVSVFQKEEGDNRLIINSLGEGGIWVCDANGNFSNGDYITSSAVVGYGMRQDDDLLHSYTVAKITMDCDFTSNIIEHNQTRYLQQDGTIITKETYDIKKSLNEPVYVAVFVGCTYHCG